MNKIKDNDKPSGLFGYFCSNFSEGEKSNVITLLKNGDYDIEEILHNRFGILCKLGINSDLITDISSISAGKISVIICSNTFNDDIPDLKELIISWYKTGNLNLLKKINGTFLVAIYDDVKEKLTIINDRFGLIKTFYYYDNNFFCFSPKISKLLKLGVKKLLRKDSIIDFFLFGYLLENKTFFENIFCLPGASILEISKSGVKLTNYWDYEENVRNDTISEKLLVDELGTIWQKAVEKRIDKDRKNIIPISGGLDSRAILAAALKCTPKENIITYTFGEKHSFDLTIGKKISKKVGVKHISIFAEKTHFQERYNFFMDDNEGMINATPYFPIGLQKYLENYQSNILTGYMGGELMGPLIFPKLLEEKLKSQVDYTRIKNIIFNHYSLKNIEDIQRLLNPHYFGTEDIMTSFEKTLKDIEMISEEDLPNYCAAWLYKNESSKYTYFCIFREKNIFKYSIPFLDKDLVDFILKIPPNLKLNKHLYKSMLKNKYPELFTLPIKNELGSKIYINNDKISENTPIIFLKKKIDLILHTLIKRDLFIDKRGLNYIDYDYLLRRNVEYQSFIRGLIEKVKEREYFNREYIDLLWDLHMKRKKNYALIFGLLATFELFLEKFVDQE